MNFKFKKMEHTYQRSKSVCPKDSFFSHVNNENYQKGFTKTFFVQEKEKGDEFFRATRVGSCRKVILKNSIPLAVTFKIKNPRGEPLTHFNYTLKKIPKNISTYFFDYCTQKQKNHLGMSKKPLVPYNPNHTRNKLTDEFGQRLFRNFSSINIGSEGLINRKQWVSNYKESFKPMKIQRIANPGILSDLAKRTHYRFNNIEYS